jgi:hypothetical protein
LIHTEKTPAAEKKIMSVSDLDSVSELESESVIEAEPESEKSSSNETFLHRHFKELKDVLKKIILKKGSSTEGTPCRTKRMENTINKINNATTQSNAMNLFFSYFTDCKKKLDPGDMFRIANISPEIIKAANAEAFRTQIDEYIQQLQRDAKYSEKAKKELEDHLADEIALRRAIDEKTKRLVTLESKEKEATAIFEFKKKEIFFLSTEIEGTKGFIATQTNTLEGINTSIVNIEENFGSRNVETLTDRVYSILDRIDLLQSVKDGLVQADPS